MSSTNQLLPNIQDKELKFCLSIGVFDGLHLGHQHLLRKLLKVADNGKCAPGVITFKNHPQTVLYPHKAVPQLTTLDKRIKLLHELGIHYVFPIDFNLAISRMSAHDFLETICEQINLRSLVVGSDFALGRDRQGTAEVLQQLGAELGFAVDIVGQKTTADSDISSSNIRSLLKKGNLYQANALLGRYYSTESEVVRGDGVGTTLGYPTANMSIQQNCLVPMDGIYATVSLLDGIEHQSITSIGERPTFEFADRKHIIETYVIDFNENLYGKVVETFFVEWMRQQEAFSTKDELVAQMRVDSQIAKTILQKNYQSEFAGSGVITL
jgi:riboflavin kinase/FMN adenylyltransferase